MKQVALLNLAIQGFRSFKRDVVFSFPAGPGFYMLTGRNDEEPALGPNGAGKSTIWDAACWVLYGQTLRGLRAKSVANWDRTDLTSVLLELRVDGQLYAVNRTWNPNSLSLQQGEDGAPKVATQQEIDDLIGLSYEGFLHTVLMGQFNEFFFDLKPADKLAVFSEALGLDVWSKAAEVAGKQAGDAEQELTTSREQASSARGRIQALKDQVQRHQEASLSYQQSEDARVAELKAERRKVVLELDKVRLDQFQLAKRVRKAQAELDSYDLTTLEDEAYGARRDEQRMLEAYEASRQAAIGLKRRMKDVRKLDGGRCSCCQQVVKPAHTQRVLARLQMELEFEQAERDKFWSKYETVGTAADELTRNLGKARKLADKARATLQARKAALDGAKDTLADLNARDSGLAGRIREVRRADNPHKAALAQTRKDLADARADLLTAAAEASDLKRRADGCNFWRKEFKNVRLWVVEQALMELGVEVNNSLIQLGLDGWEVSFDVERENKDKTISKGFNVLIKSPTSTNSVPWQAWSGGETQRLRVAGAKGLARLIQNRCGVQVLQEVWDEPTSHLSEEGIQDLLEFFEGRAREDAQQVWLVDHRSLNYGGFDGTVLIIKDHEGSRIAKHDYYEDKRVLDNMKEMCNGGYRGKRKTVRGIIQEHK